MFKVTKFYKGQEASSVENIDHGQMADLLFGEVFPNMMGDDNWSVSIEPMS